MTYDERMLGEFSCCGDPVLSIEIRGLYDGTCCWTCYTCGTLYRRWPVGHAVNARLGRWLEAKGLALHEAPAAIQRAQGRG